MASWRIRYSARLALLLGGGVLWSVILVGAGYALTATEPGEAVARQRLAVLDFALDEVHLQGDGDNRERSSGRSVVRSGAALDFELRRDLRERLRARIEELLLPGQRPAVLGRRAPEFRSADIDSEEAARRGQTLGADQVLYGTVDRIEVRPRRKRIQLTGEVVSHLLATARVRFSVLAVATGQTIWSSTLELEWVVEDELRPERVADGLLDELATHIAGTVSDLGQLDTTVGTARITGVRPRYRVVQMITESAAGAVHGEFEPNYRPIDGDRDRDGLPDYLNRDAQNGDSNNDGLPDYLNRDNLRRR